MKVGSRPRIGGTLVAGRPGQFRPPTKEVPMSIEPEPPVSSTVSARTIRLSRRHFRIAFAALVLAASMPIVAFAEQPPAPCHPNPNAAADEATVRARGDIASLPAPLQDALARLGNRPHTY